MPRKPSRAGPFRMPWLYRNVLNPWQSRSELLSQERTLRAMTRKLQGESWTAAQLVEMFRARAPDRDWSKAA